MATVPHGVEILPKISIAWVGCTNVTDDRQTDRRQTDGRQTDGRRITYSEHELEFTFANKTHNKCRMHVLCLRLQRTQTVVIANVLFFLSSFIHSFIHSFTHSFIHSFIQSFFFFFHFLHQNLRSFLLSGNKYVRLGTFNAICAEWS